MTCIALITNTPPPYRVPIFNRLARWPGIDFHAVFCSSREPNRQWDLPPMRFERHWLRERFLTVRGRYVHHNPDVVSLLNRLRPDVVVTDGFNPTHLYAFLIARLRHWPHVAMTDGTWESERALSLMHRVVRRCVFRRSGAFIAASEGGQKLYRSYGVPPERCFYSWLAVDNDAFTPAAAAIRPFDFLFCGRMEPGKDPLFALAVARDCALRLRRRTSLLFVGAGSLDATLMRAAGECADQVDVRFHGFATQQELPALYGAARVFLFPTHADVWGIVANEACAAGLPVLVTPHAGVAGELVADGCNGYVRDLQVEAWVEGAQRLLSDHALWQAFSNESLARVRRYDFDSAAAGIVDACACALHGTQPAGDAEVRGIP
jgi:glycosyltransferase involved in cell wall biosynthesis